MAFLFVKNHFSSRQIRYAHAKPKPTKDINPRRVFKVYRYDGIKTTGAPKMQSYDLDVNTCGKMVLDALIKLKDMDPSLAFRRSCREGICGSCAINLQGNNCLACITEIPPDKTITILPIPHMYVIRDLVVDMTHFFNAYNYIRPYLIRKSKEPFGEHQYAQSIEDNAKLTGLYECVLCACCSTACPSYWWNGRRFLGPAALLHAYRWVIDSRDEDTNSRLFDLRDDFAAFRCHTIMNCTLACPKGLHPALYIAQLKRLISNVDKKPAPGIDTLKHFSGKSSDSSSGSCKC
ncbi:succinate dehydrogenase [ubiquinone] iron-sulfur subunit, mitochondrial-like [Leptidea sinapis]|uniref:succinate dehydrogenase [ubiquinone] iron-sulfur subunit, mitochondrial-like n=1 Tax=Leptidea sinapis TaxID=189913 RepID=UPI0021C319CB|nr:succinate dehydrogenase [ubiquinone] iron-sulfur subunit, mitochondrial-like [Leptidea sinapis]